VIQADRAADDRPLVQREAQPVAELQAEGRVLVREAESSAVGQTSATLSVVTPGLISSIEASIHSRALT
jgi:hypothetical protein